MSQITVEELAALMKKAAGVTVSPQQLQEKPDTGFDVLGVDSLGLLGIVGELENSHGMALPPDAERCRTPRAFLDLVNSTVVAGA